jgi:hypothetical protein
MREFSLKAIQPKHVNLSLKIIYIYIYIYSFEVSVVCVCKLNSTSWDNNFWLELDYLHVAKSALNCSAYFSALLYSEIWCELKRFSIFSLY